jgi:hypothetical protein
MSRFWLPVLVMIALGGSGVIAGMEGAIALYTFN